jgi:CHASE1-domain containing sensor protein
VVVALSLGLGAYLLARAQAAAHLAFTERAQRLYSAIIERLQQPREDLATLASFLEASGRLTRHQFHVLAESMLKRHPLVYSFEWLPLVADWEREAYEAEAREAGLTDYRFWEIRDGGQKTAARRPQYVPIHYMEPPSGLALGFDVASEPERWSTAERARDSGTIATSRPFELLEDAGKTDDPVIGIYAPIYREGDPASLAKRRTALTGFAMALFRPAPLVNTASAVVDGSGLGLVLRDPEAIENRLLAERPQKAAALPRRRGFHIDYPVPFTDAKWTVTIFALEGAFLPARRTALGFASAGVLAGLLGFAAVTGLRTITRLRRQVERVGPYRLVARLGGGAMGVVWEARHALLRRPTAIKLLAPGTQGERSLARFEREVQLTAGLTHPSTIAIYDYGRTADGVFYYAMELVHGINLLQLVELEGPQKPARVIHLLRQACGALAEAHAAGLIHRDVKPANLMVCVQGGIPDFLKVLDFGLVKDLANVSDMTQTGLIVGEDAGLSQDGSLLGTPLYMAPEGMSDPSRVDARADIFAVGAVGYFLLVGRSPFPGKTALEVFRMQRAGPPFPLSEAALHPVPTCLQETIARCLAVHRAERPDSAETLGEMLDACTVDPPWNADEARAWWQDRGAQGLAAVRAQRVEREHVLSLASSSRAGRTNH